MLREHIFAIEPPNIERNQSPSADRDNVETSHESSWPKSYTEAAGPFRVARNLDNTELRHNRNEQPVTGFNLNQQSSGDDNPMMQMLQQMVGGLPNDRENAETYLPPDLAAILGGSTTRTASGTNSEDDLNHSNAYVWKIVHALSALALGVYIIMTTSFNGARFPEKKTAGAGNQLDISPRLFWIFATAEVILQSSRFFLDRGKSEKLGWLGILARNLPEPARSYVKLVLRYCRIWTTTVADAMIVVFILGCVAWWKGTEG